MNLPEPFLARMQQMLGEEFDDFLRTYEEPRQFGLRVNTLKISAEAFVKLAPFHLRPIPWTENGFYYEKEDDPARHPLYFAGLYYLQEPSAMTPAAVLPVEPGERVLDLCAAPGGKATELAAKLGGRGLLVANDVSASRAKALLKNLEIFGVGNSFVTNSAPHRLAEQFPEFFDRILVDAPCSGEGMFRKDIANARAWSPDKVHACAKLQREIAAQAARMLRPGGLLLYSTCTFSPEENEGTVAWLLAHCPELELAEIPPQPGFASGCADYLRLSGETDDHSVKEKIAQALTRCVRIFPHRMGGEGHFLALLHKKEQLPLLAEADNLDARICGEQRGDNVSKRMHSSGRKRRERENQSALLTGNGNMRETARSGPARTTRNEEKVLREFRTTRNEEKALREFRMTRDEEKTLREFMRDVTMEWAPEQIEIYNGQVYHVPYPVQVRGGIPFLRNGLYLGEVRRGRFEPSQAFAMALDGNGYASVVDLPQEDERVRRYLRGETIAVDDLCPSRGNGWQLVCVSGYPLGWGKLVNGTLKNKYHSGWRLKDG